MIIYICSHAEAKSEPGPYNGTTVNNYDPREMAQRLNESFAKAAEDARQEELARKIEADLTQKLTDKFTKHLADARASLEKTMKKQLRSKYHRMVDFFKRKRQLRSKTRTR